MAMGESIKTKSDLICEALATQICTIEKLSYNAFSRLMIRMVTAKSTSLSGMCFISKCFLMFKLLKWLTSIVETVMIKWPPSRSPVVI